MSWKVQVTEFLETDTEFQTSCPASEGRSINAGGYLIDDGTTDALVNVRVNGPVLDLSSQGSEWLVSGVFPAPAGAWTLTTYVFEV